MGLLCRSRLTPAGLLRRSRTAAHAVADSRLRIMTSTRNRDRFFSVSYRFLLVVKVSLCCGNPTDWPGLSAWWDVGLHAWQALAIKLLKSVFLYSNYIKTAFFASVFFFNSWTFERMAAAGRCRCGPHKRPGLGMKKADRLSRNLSWKLPAVFFMFLSPGKRYILDLRKIDLYLR